MAELFFTSWQAKKLYLSNPVPFNGMKGSGKDSKYNIADVRKIQAGSNSSEAPAASAEPAASEAPAPAQKKTAGRYQVEKGQPHTTKFILVDTEARRELNREIRQYSTEAEAQAEANRMNASS